MSTTWQWAKANPDAAARRIRELERENAALRAEVTVTRQNYESYKADNIGLRAAIADSEEFARKNGETLVSKARKLLAENAALRADKERLDSGTILLTVDGERVHHVGVNLRSAIDAARKEAQP